MRRLRSIVLVAACVVVPAARAAPPPCSIPGAEDWREYRSAHFIVATDVSRSTAATLVENLERTRALLLQAFFGEQVEIPGRVRVVAFGSPRQYEAMAPKDVGGYIVQGMDPPTIVMPSGRATTVPPSRKGGAGRERFRRGAPGTNHAHRSVPLLHGPLLPGTASGRGHKTIRIPPGGRSTRRGAKR